MKSIITTQLFLLFFALMSTQLACASPLNDRSQKFRAVDSLYLHHPDSSFVFYGTLYNDFTNSKDTLGQIKCLRRMGGIRFHIAKIDEALNYYTKALHLANEKEAMHEKALCLAKLGNLYCKLGHLEEGGEYIFESHKLMLEYSKETEVNSKPLIYSYVNVAELEIRKKHNNVALQYIDSCLQLAEKNYYTYGEYANILRIKCNALIAQNRLNEALDILLPLDKHYNIVANTKSNDTYYYSNSILVCSSIGLIYYKQKEYNIALEYFFKSLKLIERLQKKTDNKIFILSRIADIYKGKKQYDLAYKYRTLAFNYSENNLKVSSSRVRNVLKIRNSYIEKLDGKEKELMTQNLVLANKEKSNLRLRLIILLILSLVVFCTVLLWNAAVKSRLKDKQKEIIEKAKEKERIAEVEIHYKNRELTNYSLQLMERDDLLDRFDLHLKNTTDTDAKSLKFARKQLANNHWEEFEKRFVSIHKMFYDKLMAKYPELTVNDLKFCALVKLNLKGKEISRLLGMTEKSVHTARYRIRKKTKLEAGDSLEEFMKNI